MADPRASGMQDITTYAPARIVLVGIGRLLYALMFGLPGAVLCMIFWTERGPAQKPGGSPDWPMLAGGVALILVGLCFLANAVGKICSAFARDCWLRGGPEGISVRFPRQRWFGKFHVAEYFFRWPDVEKLVHYTYRVNGIPTTWQLRILLRDGKRLYIPRHYFSASVRHIQEQLLAINAMVAK